MDDSLCDRMTSNVAGLLLKNKTYRKLEDDEAHEGTGSP